MAKEFKTIDELIALLESRGVRTDEWTRIVLMRESYYAVVNGYKDPFLDRVSMTSTADDRYVEGTSFSNIYDLFLFDRMLRNTMMPYLILAEAMVKSAVVYAFCDKHRGVHDYLEKSSYVRAEDMLVASGFKGNRHEEHHKNLDRLLKILQGKNTLKETSKEYERHYIERHGGIPLWVLQNDLTFGNISHFYQLQERGVQNATCRIIAEVNGNRRRIGARELLDAVAILVGFRNICAHDERLYSARVKGHGFDHMLDALVLVLPNGESDEMRGMLIELGRLFNGRVCPEALNATYADTKHIPEEYR